MNIFVISDLHLGGRPHSSEENNGVPGSQINSSYGHLADFIDWLASGDACEGSVELVVNGDIVDFLMDDDYGAGILSLPWTNNEDTVIVKLKKIIERTREGRGRGPFDAMRDFLKKDHTLTLMLGNHDVELSLPKVRKYLTGFLKDKNGNLNFIYDGEAYTRGNLLIEHGNRYDRYNIIDYSTLRQERSAMSRGLPLSQSNRSSGRFKPPAGSFLVTEVFNLLKKEYRFLDLLKPETGAVVPLLLALHPKLEHVIHALLEYSKVSSKIISYNMINPAEPLRDGQLTADNIESPLSLHLLLQQEIGTAADLFSLSHYSGSGQLGPKDLLKNIKYLSSNISLYLMDNDNLFFKWKTDEKKRKQLLAALRDLQNDCSFQLSCETPEYFDAAKALSKNGRFTTIIFGHTHLPKYIDFNVNQKFQAIYINTGTWADIIRIPEEIITGNNNAKNILEKFVVSMQKNQLQEYITRYLTYAHVILDNRDNVISAQLYSFVNKKKTRSLPFSAVENI
ncbi:MAG: metallophosphoesterase [Desulfococcaceae bacterium]